MNIGTVASRRKYTSVADDPLHQRDPAHQLLLPRLVRHGPGAASPRARCAGRRPGWPPARRSRARSGSPRRRCRSPPPACRSGRSRGSTAAEWNTSPAKPSMPSMAGIFGSDSAPAADDQQVGGGRAGRGLDPPPLASPSQAADSKLTPNRNRSSTSGPVGDRRAGTAGSPAAARTSATSPGSARRRTSTAGTAHRRPRPGRCCPARCRRPRCPDRRRESPARPLRPA